jgi:hypothetical protein
MPDEVVLPQPATGQPAVYSEVARQMEIALNGGIAPKKEEVVIPAPAAGAPSAPVDIFQPFKEKFGYNNPEYAMAEIEQLRAHKANPPAPIMEFEDEESEKLFKAWTGGKKAEVLSYLEKANRIESFLSKEVTEETAGDIVKLGMQLKYKDLSPSEVEYKFKKQFSVPAKPTQGADEEEVDYNNRLSVWKDLAEDKKMELLIEAKLARPEIEAAKSKLVLPEIESSVDEGYLQYKKSLEDSAKLTDEVVKAYKAFTPKSIETKLNFKDEANKIDFDFQFEPDAESFAKAIEMTSDISKFWENFFNQDGTPNREKFLDAVYFATNKEKMLMEAMKQAKNAAIKANLPDNSQGGLVRQLVAPPVELTKVQEEMKRRGILPGG